VRAHAASTMSSKHNFALAYADKAEMESNPEAITFNCAQRVWSVYHQLSAHAN
jgi:hypothetical protein